MTVCSASINWQPLISLRVCLSDAVALSDAWPLNLLKHSSSNPFYKWSGLISEIYFCNHKTCPLFRYWVFAICDILLSQESGHLGFVWSRLQGIWLQIKHSCWHQNWQVRNMCALSVNWQMGIIEMGIDYSDMCPDPENTAEINISSYFSCDAWIKKWWLYWLDGVPKPQSRKNNTGKKNNPIWHNKN